MTAELELRTAIGPLHALRFGETGGVPVLALHGWLDNAASFVPMAPHLPGLHLVALDLPGHGRSPHLPAGAEYSLVNALHTVLDAADALGWERFALLGHSMGAGIASILAAACPERVTRLVVIEALGALVDTLERTTPRLREAVAAQRAVRGKALRVFPDIDTAVRARMRANDLSESAARLLVTRGMRRTADDAGWIWSSDPRLTTPTAVRLTEPQVADMLAHIACPVRAVFAEDAPPYFPEPLRRDRVSQLRDASLVVLPGTHHLHMEHPDAVAGAIHRFLLDAAEPARAAAG